MLIYADLKKLKLGIAKLHLMLYNGSSSLGIRGCPGGAHCEKCKNSDNRRGKLLKIELVR